MPDFRIVDYIDHMIEAAKTVQSYITGMGEQDFLKDQRTQEAVIFNIIKIGEAATKLRQYHSDFTTRHSEIDWRTIYLMRNRMAHGYFDIDTTIVWQTTQRAIPKLLQDLRAIRPVGGAANSDE